MLNCLVNFARDLNAIVNISLQEFLMKIVTMHNYAIIVYLRVHLNNDVHIFEILLTIILIDNFNLSVVIKTE